MLHCEYEKICSGCSQLQTPYKTQIQNKVERLGAVLKRLGFEIPILELTPGASGLRDRVDYMFERHSHGMSLGLLSPFQDGQNRFVADLKNCPQLTPSLNLWLKEFRETLKFIPEFVKKGSVRLRVSPAGLRGVWLDFSNENIRDLLLETTFLSKLLAVSKIEMGQKRKRVEFMGEKLKLTDANSEIWFETYDSKGESIPLFSHIGSFTQPGFLANRSLLKWIHGELVKIKPKTSLELGAGIGNFTFALAEHSTVQVLESDELALESLKKSLKHKGPATDHVLIEKRMFHQVKKESLASFDLWLADPPRSGLQTLLDDLDPATLPDHFIYISCYLESFQKDLGKLTQYGYTPVSVAILDQFPQTEHFEILVHLGKVRAK
jgi:23S rRNA (uracil1939-C5)-methyltransferase